MQSNLQLAFPNYDVGFWRRSNNFPFYDLNWQTGAEIFGGVPSSAIPFPLTTENNPSAVNKVHRKQGRNPVVESAAKLNLDRTIASATTLSAVQSSDLLFKPQNNRLSFSKTDPPLGKFVTLR